MASRAPGRSSLCSTLSFFDDSASMLRNSSARDASRSQLLEPAFRSPAAATPSQTLPQQGRRSWPDPSLLSPRPNKSVDLELPSSPACGRRGTSTPETRNSLGHRRSWLLAASSLPFRVFRPVRIKALKAIRRLETYPSGKPDSPLLPDPPCNLTHSVRTGSTRQIRYLPPGSLFLEISRNQDHDAPLPI